MREIEVALLDGRCLKSRWSQRWRSLARVFRAEGRGGGGICGRTRARREDRHVAANRLAVDSSDPVNLALGLPELQKREHGTLLMLLQDIQLPPPRLAKEVKITS
jgi:hypothetical protein